MITFGLKIHARFCCAVNLFVNLPLPPGLFKGLIFKGIGCLTIPACTTPPINWIRCRDVGLSHLLLRKTKAQRGGYSHLLVLPEYKYGLSRWLIHYFSDWNSEKQRVVFAVFIFATVIGEQLWNMQVPNRAAGTCGYSVRNYAPTSLYAQSNGSRCAPATKPASGKSFTIEALLAKPVETTSRDRSSPAQCGVKCQPAAPLLQPAGLHFPPAPYLYSPNAMHANIHQHPGYSVFCYPPFPYAPSCRGAFYAQGKTGAASDPWTSPILPALSVNMSSLLPQLPCPKLTQGSTSVRRKEASRNACAPASPASNCPGWRRSSPGSSTWLDPRGSSWPPLCSSQKLRLELTHKH